LLPHILLRRGNRRPILHLDARDRPVFAAFRLEDGRLALFDPLHCGAGFQQLPRMTFAQRAYLAHRKVFSIEARYSLLAICVNYDRKTRCSTQEVQEIIPVWF
jgi:hypothetical protein